MSNTHQNAPNRHLPYFLSVLTNRPDLLRRTESYQQPDRRWQQQHHHQAILLPGVRVHFGPVRTDDQEQLLYNTFRYELQQIVRGYLCQTYQTYPLYLVFDMTDMHFHFF